MTTNVMRLLPGMVSTLVEQAYATDAPVELVVRQKDHTELIHVTARYDDDTEFDKVLEAAKHKFYERYEQETTSLYGGSPFIP